MNWIPLAYAAPQESTGGAGSLLASFLPFLLIILIFYFLLIRPQAKERRRHQELIESLKKGDRVETTGGLIGTIQSVNQDTAVLQVADNVRVLIRKSAVTRRLEEE